MYRNAKALFYFNQYFVIRLGENLYKFNSKIENLYITRSFFTLLFYLFKQLKTRYKDTIKKKYKYVVYIESLNQKNAVLDVFNFMNHPKEEVLFIVNNGIFIDGFDCIQFDIRKSFFLAFINLPKAYIVSNKYSTSKKGIINKVHILINLSLYLASIRIFENYLNQTMAQKIILTNDHNIQPLALLLVAKRLARKSYYIQHASVSSAFPKLLPDISLLEGQQAIDIYNQIGNYSKEIKLVGIARLDGVLSFKKEVRCDDISVGFCLKPYYSIELIKEIIDVIRKSKKVTKIILRPHPGNSEEFYQSLHQFNVEVSNAKNERPHEFIKRINVMISGESSIILEASLMKIKTIYIDDKLSPFDLYGFVKNGITTFVNNSIDIKQILDNLNQLDIEKQYLNCQYYCSTVGTKFENKSKELILKILFKND